MQRTIVIGDLHGEIVSVASRQSKREDRGVTRFRIHGDVSAFS